MRSHVLLVEDEGTVSGSLSEHLDREGFETEVVGTLADAHAALKRMPDLVLLDVMLPDGDGRDLARHIRKTSDIPIVLLTARGGEKDRVVGFEIGADDYVVKPFSARELVARMHAILRRGRATARLGSITIGAITIDPAMRTCTKDGTPIVLAAREFDLLHMLMSNAGQVLTREDIMLEVWDPHWFGTTKTLDVHISWLQRKIEDDPTAPRYIATVRGVGFMFRGLHEDAMT